MSIDRNRPVYNISIVAELVGVHPRTLRIYEDAGLITPARSIGNTRLFSLADIEHLLHIRYLIQDLGVNLAGTKLILMMEQRFDFKVEEWFE